MNVLMLNGSPHPDGCTAAALHEVAAALEQEGIGTVAVQIGTGPVQGCIGCGSCRNSGSGRCVFENDPVNELLALMEQCDGLVIGSPVYYGSANGSLVALLDRLFFAGSCFRYKPACAVVSARRAGTTAAYDMLNKYFGISGMIQVPSCYWNMVHGANNCKEDVAKDLEGLRTMRTLGKNMAWLLKTLAAAREAVPLPEPEPPARTNFIR